jgi:RNA polymerase sigma-70 factor (ECF subfamily)
VNWHNAGRPADPADQFKDFPQATAMQTQSSLKTQEQLLRTAVTHAEELTRFLKYQVSNVNDGEDLMQELYVRILKSNVSEEIRSPKAYLFRVARNLAYAHRLSCAASPAHIALEEAPPEVVHGTPHALEASAPEADAMLAERLEELGDRLSELSPKVQAAILWHHRDGYTCEEIGVKLSVVRNRVKKFLGKGLAHCRTTGL